MRKSGGIGGVVLAEDPKQFVNLAADYVFLQNKAALLGVGLHVDQILLDIDRAFVKLLWVEVQTAFEFLVFLCGRENFIQDIAQ